MNTVNPRVAADGKTAVHFEDLGFDTPVPEAVRAVAEKTVAQTRQAYERSKYALEAAVETLEKSFDAAGQGAVALNRKIIDITQRNLNSGFDLAKSLAGAKNLGEFVELQADYWRKQVGTFAAQAEEVRTLSAKVATDAGDTIKAQVTRSVNELSKTN